MSAETFKSPLGFRIPIRLYAIGIALLITLGSALGMYKLALPWWAWIIEFIILVPVVYEIAKNNNAITDSSSSARVIVNRKKLLGFAAVSALIIVGIILLIIF